MCGIVGFTGIANERLLHDMADLIQHRGPDADGYYVNQHVNLASRRLRVIDLAGGDQPISNEDGSIWIVYNGEIYNHPELRQQLEAKGHVYKTNSDTETLIHLYEEYGDTFPAHLNGIFAFAIWDMNLQKLIIGRDQFGIKPLHYTVLGEQLVFGSEVKSILCHPQVERQINPQALHLFLNLRYIPDTQTLFKGIDRLPAGHVLVFQNAKHQVIKYWNPDYQVDHNRSEVDWVEALRHHLKQAVCRQLVSEVPLGIYLSGGLDSSTIAAFASQLLDEPVDTFSLGFNEPTDELTDAAFVSDFLKTRHHEQTTNAEPLRLFPEVIWHTEEPKENVIQGFLLARHARQHVTVALSGLGGDELFAGYAVYDYLSLGQKIGRWIPKMLQNHVFGLLSKLAFEAQNKTQTLSLDLYRRAIQLFLASGDPSQFYLILRNSWDRDARQWQNIYGPRMLDEMLIPTRDYMKPYFSGESKNLIKDSLNAEFHTKMVEDFLNNEDRVSMANSVEVRVPFLDVDLVELAFSIPPELKYRNGNKKYIFRKAMEGILPQETLEKPKWGFSFSSYHQFNKDLKSTAERILTKERVTAQGLFNYDYLRQIIDHKPSPRMFWHYFFLWNVMGITIWEQMYIHNDFRKPQLDLEDYMS